MLKIGTPAPQFQADALVDGQFKTLRLDDFAGKWLVLLFYPLDFTFVCPTELLAFSDRIAAFRELDAEVVGVSVDSKYTHLAWTQRPRKQGGIEGLRFPLIADLKRELSSSYGILNDEGVSLRGLFLIDPHGVVQHATINNLAVGRSVDETLRVVQAFRFVQEHGEVCPADWKPGAATINVNRASTYFEKTAEAVMGGN
jgi:alkyl hydroperoxide reductase subunit AhpC